MPPARPDDPQTNETYLCVVSEWQGGRNSGNCYPVFVLSQGKVLTKPESEFPNAGAIFMPSRAGKTFDLVSLRPIVNRTYANQSYRDCYFVPLPSSVHAPDREETAGVHSILTVPFLDPESRQIAAPAQMVTPIFFVRDQSHASRLVGPLRRLEARRNDLNETIESMSWRAESSDGLAWSFPASALEANKLRIEVYQHPNADLNDVLRRPFEFLVGKVEGRIDGGEPVDLATQDDLMRFFLSTAGLELAPEVVSALEKIPTRAGTDSPAYLRSRYDRLGRLLRSARELEGERGRVAREFLETEEGRRAIHAEIAEAKAEARAEARLDLETERQRVLAELSAIEEKKAALEKEVAAEQDHREKETASLQNLREELADAVQLSGSALQKRVLEELPGLMALGAVGPAAQARRNDGDRAEESRPPGSGAEIRPLAPARPFRKVENEALYVRWLRDELVAMGLHFSLEMVANVFTCLKCSSLTLIGGPPGVGKSSLVRALPGLMGQEHCFLEMSVRRTWADDRAILGFPDVFHRRYEPGTTGFVPHLVRGMRDLESSAGGIYLVLLDEFNLAPPEYYFSEFLRVLQKSPEDRVLRLYTPTPGMERDPIPPEVVVGPNVSFWGTVNLDETTEALSPRLLDRVQFVIVGAEDIERPGEKPQDPARKPFERIPPGKPARSAALGPYGYAELAESRARDASPSPEAKLLVDGAMGILKDGRSDWGPPITFYPRQLGEIERYLGAARPVLPATAAADLVINQRVLPGLRGRGEPFRRRIEELHDKLAAASLRRSATRLERILRHAEENYQAFDFHVY